MRSDDMEVASLVGGVLAFSIGGLVGAIGTWIWAPQVAGDLWPYIRVGAAVVGAIIGANVGLIAFYVLGVIAIFATAFLGGDD